MRMHYNYIFNLLSYLMGSVISQSLNIKTKIVYDLSSFGEQDSVSSASVSPLWPEVTNYSVISHLSCLSFHNRMSIYTTLNNPLYLLLWIAHAGEDPLDGQSGQALQYEGELHVVRGPGEQLHHQPVGLLDTEKIVTRSAEANLAGPTSCDNESSWGGEICCSLASWSLATSSQLSPAGFVLLSASAISWAGSGAGCWAGKVKIISQLFKDMNHDTPHIRPHENIKYIVR